MNMRYFIPYIILFCMVYAPDATADSRNACSVLSQIERLQADHADVRSGKMKPWVLMERIRQVKQAFHAPVLTGLFLATEKERLLTYTKYVEQKLMENNSGAPENAKAGEIWNTPSIKNLIMGLSLRFECAKFAPDVTGEDQTVPGFGPAVGKSNARTAQQPESETEAEAVFGMGTRFWVLLSGAIAMIGLLLYSRYARYREKAQQRLDCHTKALLTFGDNCTVTNVLSVGRLGVVLQAPDISLPDKPLMLYLAGFRLPVKSNWENDFYIGLDFAHAVPQETVAEIVKASHDKDPLAHLAENATSCFHPNCHLTCKKSHATQISLKDAHAVPSSP